MRGLFAIRGRNLPVVREKCHRAGRRPPGAEKQRPRELCSRGRKYVAFRPLRLQQPQGQIIDGIPTHKPKRPSWYPKPAGYLRRPGKTPATRRRASCRGQLLSARHSTSSANRHEVPSRGWLAIANGINLLQEGIANRPRGPLLSHSNKTFFSKLTARNGGYGWTRTTDTGIMSAVL